MKLCERYAIGGHEAPYFMISAARSSKLWRRERHQLYSLGLLDPEDKGIAILRNVGKPNFSKCRNIPEDLIFSITYARDRNLACLRIFCDRDMMVIDNGEICNIC